MSLYDEAMHSVYENDDSYRQGVRDFASGYSPDNDQSIYYYAGYGRIERAFLRFIRSYHRLPTSIEAGYDFNMRFVATNKQLRYINRLASKVPEVNRIRYTAPITRLDASLIIKYYTTDSK